MRDKDSYLIYENYKQNVKKEILLNEAVPLVILGAIAAPLLAYLSGKYGFTKDFMNTVKEASDGLIDLEAIFEHPVVDFASCFDPTGVTRWPAVQESFEKYEADPSEHNKFWLAFNIFSTIPLIGRLSVLFKGVTGGVGVAQNAAKYLNILEKFFSFIFGKLFEKLFSNPTFVSLLKKYFSASPKQVQQLMIGVLSVFSRKYATAIAAGYVATTDSDETPNISLTTKPEDNLQTSTGGGSSTSTLPKAKPNPTPQLFTTNIFNKQPTGAK
jgi:hypothetical protein